VETSPSTTGKLSPFTAFFKDPSLFTELTEVRLGPMVIGLNHMSWEVQGNQVPLERIKGWNWDNSRSMDRPHGPQQRGEAREGGQYVLMLFFARGGF